MLIAILEAYIEVVARLLRALALSSVIPFQIGPAERSIDERIAKIDEAKKNLVDVIAAIDALRKEAEKNKEEAAQALQDIARLEKDKSMLHEEVEALKTLSQTNAQAFRKATGIPNAKTERIIGFVSGVIASIVASLILIGIAALIRYV